MLSIALVSVAIVLRLYAGADYLVATVRGRVRPNPVTWLFWGASPLIAFAAQIQHGLTVSSFTTLALGVGPLLIFAVTVLKGRKQRWNIGIFDVICGACAAIGLALWQMTSDPTLALLFAVIADIVGGIPTVYKSYIKPESERAFPYFLSIVSMVLTMFTLKSWSFLDAGFTVYIFCINTVLAFLIWSKIGTKRKRKKPGRARGGAGL